MYEPSHLRSFLAVSQALSFTRAAERLDLRQSTVSQHVRRLEEAVGRPLLLRDTHTVELTVDGEAMVSFARDILDAHDRARRHFRADVVRGKLRLGVSEDLIATHLPEVLHTFRRRNPLVDVELTVALSGTLHQLLDARALDLVFAKRLAGQSRGRLIWRDRLVWLGAAGQPPPWQGTGEPVPLVVYPPPSISRAQALAALSSAGLPWRIACTSGSLGGLVAAARAGLGLLPHSAQLVPAGLSRVGSARLPSLGEVEFILLSRPDAGAGLVAALGDAIAAAGHHGTTATAVRRTAG
ncbi:LysR family transcriptional regulator [Solwaraspora sp. WMMB335]|uniref:LysR family transcriptional regulator n=1 Tax=Solwaraspora sp. WMMB335 TaxID=3404118 RepID=UPI003B92AD73